jgi:outer membrane receptor protein involved in Fe transport
MKKFLPQFSLPNRTPAFASKLASGLASTVAAASVLMATSTLSMLSALTPAVLFAQQSQPTSSPSTSQGSSQGSSQSASQVSSQSSAAALEDLSLEDLLNVQISVASNVISDKDKQPASITTVTRQQLQLSGGRTLADALMMFVPGFFVTEDQDDVIAAFRGLAPDNNSKVMLLVNGQNLNMEFFWGPPDAILNSTNYEWIERVEVIRGPGSVTLGQGALLGVINIVTAKGSDANVLKGDGVTGGAAFSAGLNNLYTGAVNLQARAGDVKAAFSFSRNAYEGQQFRNEGHAKSKSNEGFAGGTVFDMNHRLKRNDNLVATANVEYKGLELNIMHVDSKRDLYNFYRDREVFGHALTSFGAAYNADLSDVIKLRVSGNYAQDNVRLLSLTGTNMGGIREDRFGGSAVLTLDKLWQGNKLAIGVEYRRFEMGKPNSDGNNFIGNKIGTFDPRTANRDLTMGYRFDINVFSIFAEDFWSVTDQLDVFAALRFDNHSGWGTNLTPRVGALFAANKDLRFRASYQMGFRGTVGLSYSGGYRNDGYMRIENFSRIEAANIPNERNRPAARPEIMHSVELAANAKIVDGLTLDVVGFYNVLQSIIDVGVIYQDPARFRVGPVGSDVPGDWNGYWFFKNAPGSVQQVGGEASLRYTSDKFNVTLSHALVAVAGLSDDQRAEAKSGGSMYLAADAAQNHAIHFKVVPENVTRLNIFASPLHWLNLTANALWYSSWYTPNGGLGRGNFIVNFGAGVDVTDNIEISANVHNILNQTNLYPMNSNAGGPDVSPGTPAMETTTFWGRIRVRF